jgi:hypothetical protein
MSLTSQIASGSGDSAEYCTDDNSANRVLVHYYEKDLSGLIYRNFKAGIRAIKLGSDAIPGFADSVRWLGSASDLTNSRERSDP